ncbi:unnamed protein product [Chilo suppressalis]|uniref:Uncharacterized protein n=1 Tax=Chilo suppressalis TaxID=168631 RepID=A0ABN8BBN2_CHISP|nr:unnamed protein product [Chilo suppressalis]
MAGSCVLPAEMSLLLIHWLSPQERPIADTGVGRTVSQQDTPNYGNFSDHATHLNIAVWALFPLPSLKRENFNKKIIIRAKLKRIVAKVLASRTKNKVPDMVATSQLTILHDLVTLLGPFKIVTEDLSAEKYVTASLVIPLTNLLKQEIEQTKISTAIGLSVQNVLLKGIEDRLVSLQENLLLAKATILDPRFKKLHFMSAMAAANAITDLSKEIIAEHKIRGNRSPTVGVSPRVEKETTSSLWDRHENMLLKNMSNANEVFGKSFSAMPAELKQYLDQPNISSTTFSAKFKVENKSIPIMGLELLTMTEALSNVESCGYKDIVLLTDSASSLYHLLRVGKGCFGRLEAFSRKLLCTTLSTSSGSPNSLDFVSPPGEGSTATALQGTRSALNYPVASSSSGTMCCIFALNAQQLFLK